MKNKKPPFESRPWVRWYKLAAWKKLRSWQLRRQPLCQMCLPEKMTKGRVVDHISPHKGDMQKFFDRSNLQTLCDSHHSSTKQKIEKSGDFGCDENGIVPAWKV